VYIWLEREVEALRLLCGYGDQELEASQDLQNNMTNDGTSNYYIL